MAKYIFCIANRGAVLCAAAEALKSRGYGVVDRPCESVTHLLLPVPSFEADGNLKGGGRLAAVLSQLPKDITIIGGNLPQPLSAAYHTVDLLQNEDYLAENAAITAHCALAIAMNALPCTLDSCPVLVIGWGRIGKCLARLLRQLDAPVTVTSGKETHRATLRSMGYSSVPTSKIDPTQYRVIFNTAPHPVLPDCAGPALKIDLASSPGITGDGVIWARGLPNKNAPESSGALIANAVASYLKETEVAL